MTKDDDFNRAAADQVLDIQEAHRDLLKGEPTAPPNPGHPGFDRPHHYYLVRLYDHSARMEGSRKWPYFIAAHEDYENEGIGGAETEARAIAEAVNDLLDTMCANMDAPSEKATRTLAAALIMEDQRDIEDRRETIEKIISEIPDPDSERGQLQAALWRMLNIVQDHGHEDRVDDFTNARLFNILHEHLSRWNLDVGGVYLDPPDDAEPEPV